MRGKKRILLIVIGIGLMVAGLMMWRQYGPQGVPVLVEGTVDLGSLFADSDEESDLDVGVGLVRLEGRDAETFGSILRDGRPTLDHSTSLTGGFVTLRFANGKEDQVYLSRPPVVASFRWRHAYGLWYTAETPRRFVELDQERLRDLLEPCLEETRKKQMGQPGEIRKN